MKGYCTNISSTTYSDELNEAQRQAVAHDGGPLLIVAGAGTGKTKTLASRVARLLADGAQPDRVLLLTFTRRAAAEMLARARRLAAVGTDRVWGGTFHSIANRLLRDHGNAVGLRAGFTVLDQTDTVDLLGLVRSESGLGERKKRFPRKDTLAAVYSRVANAQLPLSDVIARWFPWVGGHDDDIRTLFGAYRERKQQHNVVDYDDLLLYWRALLGSDAGRGVTDRFDHVLVDEYQDTNSVQADILVALGDGASVTAVGDDAQAIYAFRAASAANMSDFTKRFADATIVTLEQNYRSTQPILDAANEVMASAAEVFAKRLWSERNIGVRPSLTSCLDESTQADVVCNRILEHREQGVELRNQAVLFRTGHHSEGLELELARRDIPFVKYGGLKFLEAAHIKDLMAALRILDNPADVLAWHRIVGRLEGVGPVTVRRVCEELGVGVDGGDPLEQLLAAGAAVPSSAAGELAELRAAFSDCQGVPEPVPASQIERLVPFFKQVFPHNHDRVEVRLADLDHVAGLAGEYRTRSRFLAELTLDPPASTADLAGPPHLDDDYLILSTIHSAKGGEWRVVHLICASDGNIPSDMALGEPDGLAEERRLLYVAMTRAQDTLHVTWPARFHHRRFGTDDAHSYGQPSRFLEPAKHLFEESQIGWAVACDEPAPVGTAAAGDPVGDLLERLWR